MSVIAEEVTFQMRVTRPKVKVVKRDREVEAFARRNAKSAMESLALLYPEEFRQVADKILLTRKPD